MKVCCAWESGENGVVVKVRWRVVKLWGGVLLLRFERDVLKVSEATVDPKNAVLA